MTLDIFISIFVHIFITDIKNNNKTKHLNIMKLVEKKLKYQLMSGDEEITKAYTIQEIANAIGASWSYVQSFKNKDFNKDGSWSFNFKGYNYTIINLINNEK